MKFFRGFLIGGLLSLPFLVGTAFASPFMVSDPNSSAVGGYSDITGAPSLPNPVPLQPDGSVKVDLVNAPVGTTDLQVRVCINQAEWGPLCSPFVRFVFNRPGAPSAPTGLGIVK